MIGSGALRGTPAWLSNTMTVSTPEAVEFTYDLAGPSHRLLAWLIDTMISFALIAVVWMIVVLALMSAGMPGTAEAVGRTLAFAIGGGYYIVLEALSHGQTPGKKVMGIRVLDSRGFRITPAQAAIRNLMRAVDLLPFCYLVGGISILCSRRGLRLGDLAAGTVVVRVPSIPAPESFLPPGQREESLLGDFSLGERVRRVLLVQEKDLLASLAVRRDRLDERSRMKIFEAAATAFSNRLSLMRPMTMSAETFVLHLAAIAHAPRPAGVRAAAVRL
ncbi:MAG: RDD family protein [Candidatus Brocadiae bacterium]|nr:RDD family protein [Candidatus Brocadiia bacterium]